MSEEVIERKEKRIKWLKLELQYEARMDGYTAKGHKEEIIRLTKELEELKKND